MAAPERELTSMDNMLLWVGRLGGTVGVLVSAVAVTVRASGSHSPPLRDSVRRASMYVRTVLPPLLIIAASGLAFTPAEAQLADRKALTLDGARRIMAAAEAEAHENKWNVAIAIVDEAGELLLFQKLDDTQVASVNIAIGKARTAARFRRPSKALEDTILTGGRSTLMTIEGVLPLEGGVPILADGRVIGAVGVSGVTSQQDAQIAEAGIAGLGLK